MESKDLREHHQDLQKEKQDLEEQKQTEKDLGKDGLRWPDFGHQRIVDNDKIEIMRKLADKFGVRINVIAKGRKTFMYDVGPTTRFAETGIVPEGKSYVRISSRYDAKGVNDFDNALSQAEYEAEKAREKAKLSPSIPPLIENQKPSHGKIAGWLKRQTGKIK